MRDLRMKLECNSVEDQANNMVRINIPQGPKYISDVVDELPSNCIINKGVTGCGGTHLELTTKRNSIIVVPTVSLIKNKLAQSDRYEDNIKLYGVYAGHSFTKAKISAMVNRKKDTYVKIMVTYDSFKKSKELRKLDDWFVLVDEWHVMFNSYDFRQDAIDSLTESLKSFKHVAYMTASPVRREFIPTQLEGLKTYTFNWLNNDVCKVKQVPTNKPIHVMSELCKDYLNDKQLGNAHIFLNSVRNINDIVSSIDLDQTLSPKDVF